MFNDLKNIVQTYNMSYKKNQKINGRSQPTAYVPSGSMLRAFLGLVNLKQSDRHSLDVDFHVVMSVKGTSSLIMFSLQTYLVILGVTRKTLFQIFYKVTPLFLLKFTCPGDACVIVGHTKGQFIARLSLLCRESDDTVLASLQKLCKTAHIVRCWLVICKYAST